MSRRIDRVDTRRTLEPRRDPYWLRLSQGQYVGFRRLTRDSPGTWLARFYDGEKYQYQPLSDFGNLADKERYDAAKDAAEAWFKHLDVGGSTERVTVKQACEAYVARLRNEKSEASAKDAEGSFRRLIDDDPIARIELAKLKPAHVAAWRDRVLGRGSHSYFNRNLTALRAALNFAYDERKVASDFAWSKALRPLKLDPGEGRRQLYIDRAQRAKLIDHASDELRPLLIAWTLLPLRPGDVAKLHVEHFNKKQKALLIPQGKTASRVIPLTAEVFAHFNQCAKNKLPGAWLIARADGSQWTRFAWRDALWEAVKAAKLPRATVAYSLRHASITDMVTSGTDIFTVAKLSGTSVAMIEKHYGHLQHEHARKALETLSLKRH